MKGDNEPIGVVLSTDKDEVLVGYATGGIYNKIFVSKYQLYTRQKTTTETNKNCCKKGISQL